MRDEITERLTKNKYFDLILSTLKNLISRNNIKLSEIKEVEFVGGAFRYPEIKQAYTDEFEKEKGISTHLNGDETFTMGGL